MNRTVRLLALLSVPAFAAPTPAEILDKVLDVDPWGLSGAEVVAKVEIKDKDGKVTRTLAYQSRSRQHDRNLSKSLIRFTAPGDLVGVGFLQNQQREGDDERFLYLPDLKKSRRIAGKLRSQAFMNTDFSYADMDRRDMRNADAKLLGEETLGKFPCYHLDVKPKGNDAEYSRIEMWVRKDNFLPLKYNMFDPAGSMTKTMVAGEVQRIGGKWFMTRSSMVNHKDSRSTALALEKVTPKDNIPDDEFSVRTLEKS